jgi:hypothetical protein
MPRYHFRVQDGVSLPDIEGVELADVRAARDEAARLAGAMLTEAPEVFWRGEEWKLEVTDDRQTVLFTLNFSASDTSLPD